MAYIDVLPLATVKQYLRIDDTLTEDDTQLTRMIESALKYIEKHTNIHVVAKDKDYDIPLSGQGCLRVYDYPINTLDADLTDYEIESRTLYKVYWPTTTQTTLTLNVGYEDEADVPVELIDVALEIIDLMYYGNKTTKDLSVLSVDILNQNKRFLI